MVWKKAKLKAPQVFGSDVMVHVPKARRKQFDPKSTKGLFVGYCEDAKGYRVYDPKKGNFVINRDVVVLGESAVRSKTRRRCRVHGATF